MDMEKHLKVLGLKVEDKVTGLKGIISSVSFDLYGCIQALIAPKADNDGKVPSGYWVDIPRLKILSKKPVMELPKFNIPYVAEGKKGPAEKPV